MREIKFLKADLAQAAKKVERLERLVKEKDGHYIHFVKDVLDDLSEIFHDCGSAVDDIGAVLGVPEY